MNTEFSATSLRRSAQGWLKVYRSIDNLNCPEIWAPQFICFCYALELYLKSFIVLLNNDKYGNSQELKKINHNFIRMLRIIEDLAPKQFSKKLGSLIKKYFLDKQGFDFSRLRYPKNNGVMKIFPEIMMGNHGFDELFIFIDKEIDQNLKQ